MSARDLATRAGAFGRRASATASSGLRQLQGTAKRSQVQIVRSDHDRGRFPPESKLSRSRHRCSVVAVPLRRCRPAPSPGLAPRRPARPKAGHSPHTGPARAGVGGVKINECGALMNLPGRVPFLAGIARPRLGCAGPVVPGGLGVIVVRCPARRVRDYPGGSGPPGGSGTPWGPRSTRQAISTRLSAGPGAGGAPGPAGRAGAGGRGFRGRGRGGRLAGRGRAEATRPPRGSWRSLVPGGPDLPRLPGRRPGPVSPGPVRRKRGWPHRPAVPAATGHTDPPDTPLAAGMAACVMAELILRHARHQSEQVTLITRRRAWLAGWVWVLTKSALEVERHIH